MPIIYFLAIIYQILNKNAYQQNEYQTLHLIQHWAVIRYFDELLRKIKTADCYQKMQSTISKGALLSMFGQSAIIFLKSTLKLCYHQSAG